MTTPATEVLADHMNRDSPQVRRRRAIWSMIERLSTNNRNGYFSRPSNLRWRSPQRSIIDPPVCRRYRFSRCLPNIATNAASRRLAYRRSDVVMISVGDRPTLGEQRGLRLERWIG